MLYIKVHINLDIIESWTSLCIKYLYKKKIRRETMMNTISAIFMLQITIAES